MGHAPGNPARRTWKLTLLGAFIAAAVILASQGPDSPLAAAGAVLHGWTSGGVAGLLWCAAAVGLGLWIMPGKPGLTRLALAGAIGTGLMLWTAHLAGVLGLYRGALAIAVAWAPVLIGLVALAGPIRRALSTPPRDTNPTGRKLTRIIQLACLPALAVISVAVCIPPGTLWESEARGYDTLSYHLALPKEWLALGRLTPLEHNAYSLLPSFIEAAYLQLAAMLGGAGTDGRWTAACAALHAGLALLAALCIAALTRGIVRRADSDHPAPPWIAGAAAVVVPWTAVTASLSYNEMGMLLGTAGACLFAIGAPDSPHPRKHAVLLGFSLAVATACKPTAAFMGGPLVLLCILAWNPRRAWPRLLMFFFLGAAIASAPWLVRNALYSGNPVFPALSTFFGTAHWSPDQIERWNAAHHAHAGILGSAHRLLSPDGVLHPQWSLFFAALLGSVIAVSLSPQARRAAWPLLAGLFLQLLAWTAIGHQQPRFLMPCILTGAATLGVAASILLSTKWHRAGGALVAAVILLMSLDSARLYMNENAGQPARALVPGCPAITGTSLGTDEELAAIPRPELIAALAGIDGTGNPVAATNRLVALDAAERAKSGYPPPLVYLLGDATPLYFTVPVLWNTTWDRWPLEEARAEHPDNPPAWAEALRHRGVTHILINLAEIDRLRRSGYSPPGMTPDAGARFVREACTPIVEWPAMGSGLFALPRPPAPASR